MQRWAIVACATSACAAALLVERPRQECARRLRPGVPLAWLLLPALFDAELARELDLRPVERFSGSENSPAADRCRGAVAGLAPPLRADFFGTFLDAGAEARARWQSQPFHAARAFLYVPVMGSPAAHGMRVVLEAVPERGGAPEAKVVAECALPGGALTLWRIELPDRPETSFRLRISDDSPTTWVGVARPFTSAEPEAWSRLHQTRVLFWAALFDAVLLLFLPGLAWSCRGGGSAPSAATALFPLPGVVLLALWGLGLWLTGLGEVYWLGAVLRWIVWLVSLVVLWWSLLRNGRAAQLDGRTILVYAAVVTAAVAYARLDLEVAQEAYADTPWRARMAASPTDHTIPFFTGVFFVKEKSGVENNREYFGDWSVGSRGPLAGLMIAAGLHAAGVRPTDPPYQTPPGWVETHPMDRQGFWIARFFGILSNGLVILAAGWLLEVLGGTPAGRRYGLAWLALSPLVAINVGYLWPKLFACYFICLTTAWLLSSRRPAPAALLTALGYYAHPLAALFAPAFFGLAWRRRSVLTGVGFGIVLALALVPWLAYKAALKHPEPFAGYLLGDGDRFDRARSLATWVSCRLDNTVQTLVPGAFFWGPFMHEWLAGPLSPPLRWVVQYAKTLPGHVGFGLFGVAYLAVFWPVRARPSWPVVLSTWGTFALMLVYWGYSRDGLGRNCLEPISVLVILLASARLACPRCWHYAALFVVMLESWFVQFGSLILAPTFAGWPIDFATNTAAVLVIAAAMVAFGAGGIPLRQRGAAPASESVAECIQKGPRAKDRGCGAKQD